MLSLVYKWSRTVLLLLLLILLSASGTSANKFNLNEFVLFEGEMVEKQPQGYGVLYCKLNGSNSQKAATFQMKKYQLYDYPKELQDVVKGTFLGESVNDAQVDFSSGWEFKGNLKLVMSDTYIEYTLKSGGRLKWNDKDLLLQEDLQVKRVFEDMKIQFTPATFFCGNFIYNFLIDLGSDFLITARLDNNLIRDEKGNLWTDVWTITPTKNSNAKGARLDVEDDSYTLRWPNGDYYNLLKNGADWYITDFSLTLSDGTRFYKPTTKEKKCVLYLSNGDRYEGRIYLGVFNNSGKKETSDELPSIDPQDALYYKKISLTNNCYLYSGDYFLSDGTKMRYNFGKSDRQRLEEEKAARAKTAVEREKQAKARAEKEKNTKATQAFLNSAWGKRFTFNGFEDTYGNYHHGSSVLRFSNNRTDIWLEVEGETYWFKIDHIADDTGKDIWVKNWNGMMAVVYITPMMRNGKRAFKVHFTTADLVYYLY